MTKGGIEMRKLFMISQRNTLILQGMVHVLFSRKKLEDRVGEFWLDSHV